jgi:hypothetical protein
MRDSGLSITRPTDSFRAARDSFAAGGERAHVPVDEQPLYVTG